MVWPSGGAWATIVVPTVPPAPPRLSITIRCLRLLAHGSTKARPTASIEPPASKGTTMRIGRFGNGWRERRGADEQRQDNRARQRNSRHWLHDELAHHLAGLEHAMRARRFRQRNAVVDRHLDRALLQHANQRVGGARAHLGPVVQRVNGEIAVREAAHRRVFDRRRRCRPGAGLPSARTASACRSDRDNRRARSCPCRPRSSGSGPRRGRRSVDEPAPRCRRACGPRSRRRPGCARRRRAPRS